MSSKALRLVLSAFENDPGDPYKGWESYFSKNPSTEASKAAQLWQGAVSQQSDWGAWKKNPTQFSSFDDHAVNLAVALEVGENTVLNGKDPDPLLLQAYIYCREGPRKVYNIYTEIMGISMPAASYYTQYMLVSMNYEATKAAIKHFHFSKFKSGKWVPSLDGLPEWSVWASQYTTNQTDSFSWNATTHELTINSTPPPSPPPTPPTPGTVPLGVLTPASGSPGGTPVTLFVVLGVIVAGVLYYKYKG